MHSRAASLVNTPRKTLTLPQSGPGWADSTYSRLHASMIRFVFPVPADEVTTPSKWSGPGGLSMNFCVPGGGKGGDEVVHGGHAAVQEATCNMEGMTSSGRGRWLSPMAQ